MINWKISLVTAKIGTMTTTTIQRRRQTCRSQGCVAFWRFEIAVVFILCGSVTALDVRPQKQQSTRRNRHHQRSCSFSIIASGDSSTSSSVAASKPKWFQSISKSYARRVAADPSFTQKSITELLLAAGTQLTAEWNRRGAHRLIPELDFVVGGVLTAMAGKYYSMWRVAPTKQQQEEDDDTEQDATTMTTTASLSLSSSSSDELRFGNMLVPTNAFQSTMLDGVTCPTPMQRVGAFIAPMPYLFRAGVMSSAFGYGLTAIFVWIRSILLPSYLPQTQSINILYASLYTGGFLAIVSNVRYQILQGIIEPKFVNRFYHNKILYTLLSVAIRLGNGFLGSMLGIMGMRRLGLQRMK